MSATPLRTNDSFIIAAARVARASGPLWEEFKRAFDAVVAEKMALCVHAPPDQVIIAQGKAQHAAELSSLFENAVIRASELETKMKGK